MDGDAEVQQAVRFALFHVLQAGARGENRADPGEGPDRARVTTGTRSGTPRRFVLPVLSLTAPDAAANALRWRHSTLPLAIERAAQLGLQGAAFPWRTITGQECSGYWPAGTAAFHVNADIADAVVRYVDATGDEEFRRGDRGWSCWPTPRGCGAPSATTTPRGSSTSTGSPARTSTAPSPTTTSTPT